MLNGNMADYLVPMAAEMPDIECGHVVSPTADSELGAKGAGEAGTAGAPACVMNAINDALRPLDAAPLTDMPFTPGQDSAGAREGLVFSTAPPTDHLASCRKRTGCSASATKLLEEHYGRGQYCNRGNCGGIHTRPKTITHAKGRRAMDIKVGKKAIEEASKKLSNWGRWGKDDQIGTLNHVTPEDIVKAAS